MKRIALLADFPLHTIPTLGVPAPSGHYATWLPQLSAAFAERPVGDLHWLVVTRRSGLPASVEWQGQTFHLIHEPGRMRALFGFRRESRRIRAVLKTIGPQFVHAWGTEACYGLAAKRSGFPFLLSMQGILSHYVRAVPMPALVRLQAWYERQVFRATKHATVESHWGERILRQWLPTAQISLVEYGVQPSFFEVPWAPTTARPAAIFVGSIQERKGVHDAVAAFRAPALAEAELWIVGDPADEWGLALQRSSPPNVRWLGRLGPAETAARMSEAWCLVLPTRADTSPNVVKEARVIGLPVISTPHGGQSDYIKDGENGFLVEAGEVATLANRLAILLRDRASCIQFGAWNHQEQRAWFAPGRTADGFAEIYRKWDGS